MLSFITILLVPLPISTTERTQQLIQDMLFGQTHKLLLLTTTLLAQTKENEQQQQRHKVLLVGLPRLHSPCVLR